MNSAWPLYIDALDTLDLSVVPVPLGIDESGVVRLDGRITKETVEAFTPFTMCAKT